MTSRGRKKREFSSGSQLSAKAMVKKVKDLTKDWSYDVISLGYPGPVLRNRPIAEPYNLGRGWAGFDFANAFDRPTRVVNDALMQALGNYNGGRMLFLGLGTGLGSAMIVDGVLQPMELGHLPYRKGKTFEYYVGAAGLKRLGKKRWQQKVADVAERFAAALQPEYIVMGRWQRRKSRASSAPDAAWHEERRFCRRIQTVGRWHNQRSIKGTRTKAASGAVVNSGGTMVGCLIQMAKKMVTPLYQATDRHAYDAHKFF
jgi:polyphosphate glucokinase